MVAILGFIRTEVTPSSFRALRACEPIGREIVSAQFIWCM